MSSSPVHCGRNHKRRDPWTFRGEVPGGDEGRAEGRSRCNMWSPRLGRAKQFLFNWPCNLPQLVWITGESSSLEWVWRLAYSRSWTGRMMGSRGARSSQISVKMLLQLTVIYLLSESKHDQWKTLLLQFNWTMMYSLSLLSKLGKSDDKTTLREHLDTLVWCISCWKN